MPKFDPQKFQIIFFKTPCSMPFSIARHPFVVINRRGVLSRFEVFYKPNMDGNYVYKDGLPGLRGIPVFEGFKKYFWKSKQFGIVENNDELAQRMADFIEASKENYPLRTEYQFTGNNSNTYMSWILKSFPETGIKLPWNCFGKKF